MREKSASAASCPLADSILADGGQRRIRHAGDVRIVKTDNRDILRNAHPSFAQAGHDGHRILIAGDADARKASAGGQPAANLNAALCIEGVQGC